MHRPIRKAVFPVAGMGTRFLPATKASPKEMLPVVDKPLVQYAAEEAVKAGIEVLIFITGRHKRPIPDHFDKAYELEAELERRGKTKHLREVREILPNGVKCIYIRQCETLGLGHAVACAQPVVGDEPFAVILADDLIDDGEQGCLAQMVERYRRQGGSLLGVERVPKEHTDRYGIVSVSDFRDRLGRLQGIVEKPAPEKAPSNLGVVGRYILSASIFEHLANTRPGAGGEIQLTDAIEQLRRHEAVYAYEFAGRRYDCGDKLGYLQANVDYALKHPELGAAFAEYLRLRGQRVA
ncbi:UTP--glucose-1-phosphate uridylyltransferase GalU [Alkalilimnicola sp. S0819]|uniref:UTP--glucose-1-phosphate uridylyltransferase GalU n=1 Tax=Alkalilimnicola sp. S0819 TaxID=2613922 RepID=UPI001261DACB|nr:UTP--glucose-1-phosphate uridylyltransferase GalU [Alkalilimnicola sp. S0819]KAB7623652.1 UTP--glucose-1-phosphate uridylyltransferase GalU [Alkalilimnicola sp. S0819]MPQ16776.1 UTP--glucose-1-phosphate uridylyltransferase GalU [Alkalilimnicola sp. S0819]